MKIENLIMQGLMRNSRNGVMEHEKSPLLSHRHDGGHEAEDDGRREGDQLDETTRLASLPSLPDKNEEHPSSSSDQDITSSSYLKVPSSFLSESQHPRRGSVIDEMRRQSAVFFDDSDVFADESDESSGAWNKISPPEKET